MMSRQSNRPFLKVAALLTIIIVCFWIASFFSGLVVTLIVSGLSAFVMRPLVKLLEFRLGLRRSLSIAIVFLLAGGSTVFVLMQIIPLFVDTVRSMYDAFKVFNFDDKLTDVARGLTAHVPFIKPEVLVAKAHAALETGLQTLGDSAGSLAGYAVNLAIVPFITYFILAEGDAAMKKLIERVPNKYFEMTLNVLHKIGHDLVGYLKGWILDSAIIGVLTMIGLTILGVQYSVLLGALAGVANLIPYVGVAVAATLAIVVSLTQLGNFSMLVPIGVTMLIIRGIDDTIVQPMCFAKSIDMHPLMVILVLIIGHELLGVAGLVLAIPLATILRVSAIETYWGLKHYSITA
ncbi:MAG TPA: AI-2E family transporter [Bacteroidota bacterium]